MRACAILCNDPARIPRAAWLGGARRVGVSKAIDMNVLVSLKQFRKKSAGICFGIA